MHDQDRALAPWSHRLPIGREADRPLPFRVSDAGRRRKVVGARTRGPQAVSYGNLDYGQLRALTGAAEMRTDLKADRLLFGER